MLQWLDGATITTDDGRPWTHQPGPSGRRPFRYFKDATTPAELAHAILSGAFPADEAAKCLAHGDISYWAGDFDEVFAEEIKKLKLEDEVTKDQARSLRRLAFASRSRPGDLAPALHESLVFSQNTGTSSAAL